MGFFRPPFAQLTDALDEVVWRGDGVVPPREVIADANYSLAVARPRLKPKGLGLVVRTQRHLLSWAEGYLNTEDLSLKLEFVSSDRYFECLLMRSIALSEINIAFRLGTKGIDGYTQYRIAWRRIGEDEFVCLE